MKRRMKIQLWSRWGLKRRPGISLLFAMTIVTISFIIMVGSIDLATSTVQNTRATSYRLDAYYGALSGLEQAGWTVAEQSADYEVTGYETDGDLDDATNWESPVEIDTNGDGDYDDPGDSTTYYYIAGQSGEIDGYNDYLYNPRPGTGTAGSNCSIFNPPTDEDDPCAWNKLDIGDIVSIPLYYSNTDGTDIENPSNNSGDWTSFELYIRTPCWDEASETCTGGSASGGSDVIVNWEIVADCDEITNGCYLIPYDNDSDIDSYIYKTDISNTTPVLQNDTDSKGEDQEGMTYKTVKTFITQSGTPVITKPVLHFSIIDTWNGSSYLEYQVRTKNENSKTANANITLVAKGYGSPTQEFEQTLTRTLGRSTNVIQFVFNN